MFSTKNFQQSGESKIDTAVAEALDRTSGSPFHAVAACGSIQTDESEVSLWLKHITVASLLKTGTG